MSETVELRNPKDVIINGVSLDKLIKDHQHYICRDCDGWQKMRLCIIDEDLTRINFEGLDISRAIFVESRLDKSSFNHCNLSYTNLSRIIGSDINFKYANLFNTIFTNSRIDNGIFYEADITDAKFNDISCNFSSFEHATIRHTDFANARLRNAIFKDSLCGFCNFSDCMLDASDFSYATIDSSSFFDAFLHLGNFEYADIKGSSFYTATLIGANFKNSKIDDETIFSQSHISNIQYNNPPISIACPEEGSFIGFKVGLMYNAEDLLTFVLIKLEIPADAKRSSGTGKKCRCSKATVLDITDLSSNEQHIEKAVSLYSKAFEYKVGETVHVDDFDDNRWDECSAGIHFFMSKDDAIRYIKSF